MPARRHTRSLLGVAAFALLVPTLGAQQPLPADSLELGRKYAFWFLTGAVDSLTAHMTPDVAQALGGRAGLLDGHTMVATRAGIEVRLLEERFAWRNGQRQYWRRMQMSVLEEPFLLRFVLRADGSIGGLGMGPASAAPPVDSGGAAIRQP